MLCKLESNWSKPKNNKDGHKNCEKNSDSSDLKIRVWANLGYNFELYFISWTTVDVIDSMGEGESRGKTEVQ